MAEADAAPRARRRAGGAWIANISAGMLLLCLAVLAAANARDELRLRAIDQLARAPIEPVAQAGASAEATAPANSVPDPALDAALPPAAALSTALLLARLAADLPEDRRRAGLLARSALLLDRAAASRPGWGQASVVAAYREGVHSHRATARTTALFARSYREAPFLRREAEWRLQYGIRQWAALSPATRESVLAEALWVSRFSPAAGRHVRLLMRGTPVLARFEALRRQLF